MEESKRCFLQAFQISDETGYAIRNPHRAYFLIHVRSAGDYENNLRLMHAKIEKARQQDNVSLFVFNLSEMLSALSDLGRYQQVIELIDEYVTDIESVRGPSGKWNTLSRKGMSYFFLGEKETGVRLMADACEHLKSGPPSMPYSIALMRLALAKSFKEDSADLMEGLEIAKQAVSPFYNYWLSSKASNLRITARLHLKLGQVEQAMAVSNEMNQILEHEVVELRTEIFYWTHTQVLRADGQEQVADFFLKKAYNHILQMAEKITDDGLRRSYLENVWENREILKEAELRGIPVE
jgi:tetratricopeptide (TPR) repeat protein